MSAADPRNVLLPHHEKLIEASAILPDVAEARGYRSVTTKAELERLGFGKGQLLVPTLLIPIWGVTGEIVTYQHRPDSPRIRKNKPLKYETPAGSLMRLDVPPKARPWIGDPAKPLFITEGVRKADSAVSRDLCCIALLGVWNFRGKNEQGGKTALTDWELVALEDRMVYIIFDSDVMLRSEVYAALVRLKAFLELRRAHTALIYLPPGRGGKKQGLDDFFGTGSTVKELIGLASPELRNLPKEHGPASRFEIQDGRICRTKLTPDGPVAEPLCNFTATITEELVHDDGAERSHHFAIEGRLASGVPLPLVTIPSSKFPSMNWVTDNWGLRAVVRAGQATKDYLREAIQEFSREAQRRSVFTHTGWREIDDAWAFLTQGGAIRLEDVEVDLGPDLARYQLPRVVEDRVGAMRLSLQFLTVASMRVTAPILAAIYRAPLAAVLPVDHSLAIEGPTGSLKSTVTALGLAHYGPFDRLCLPGSWSSTANQLERRAFILKDVVFVIDDYVPTAADARELELKAHRVLRAQGNRAGRGRLHADLTDRPAFPPRGFIISTGEQHPSGQSILARMLVLKMDRRDVDLSLLTKVQGQASLLPHAMAGYIQWLAPQMSRLGSVAREKFADARDSMSAAGHLRVPETMAHLRIGIDFMLAYAEEIEALPHRHAEELRHEVFEVFLRLGRDQAVLVEGERPTRQFLTVLATMLATGEAALLPKDDAGDLTGERGASGKEMLGWQDDAHIYLLPDAAYRAVTRFCKDSNPFVVTDARLRDDLVREGIAEPDKDRKTTTAKINGHTRRVLKLHTAAVEGLIGQTFTSPVESPVGHRAW